MIANPPLRRVEVMDAKPLPLTHADFMALAPEDRKAELIDGELIIMPTPSYMHERLVAFLLKVLGVFADSFNLGIVLGSRTAVRIGPGQTYEPDLLFIQQSRQHIIAEREVIEAPDLVIEVLSASTVERDRGVKREQYEQAGVSELWSLDPYGPAGTQFFQRRGETLTEVMPVDGVVYSSAMTGFQLKLKWLWPAEGEAMPSTKDVLRELKAF